MYKEERHPATELLLRALDGELSRHEAKAVRRHLQACWKCRMESDEISGTVHAYTALSTRMTSPERLQPPNGWAAFPAALHKLAEQRSATTRKSLGQRFAPLFFGRVAFGLQAAALFVCAVWLWTKLSSAPSVSASELLARATNDEIAVQESLQTKRAPGVFRKVRYRLNRRMLTRSSYRDFRHHRRSERWESAEINTPERELTSNALRDEKARWDKTMARAQLSFDEPLSARKFQQWLRDERYPHHESVSRSEHRFRLISEIGAGPVHKAELVLRTPDYHPIQERFRFADDEELEITELAYEVRPPEHVDDYAEAPRQTSILGALQKNGSAHRRSVKRPDPLDMNDTEMTARLILHRERADLGEQVGIERERNAVAVSGIVETAERRAELTSALRSVAGLRVQLQTLQEAAAQPSKDAQRKTTILPSSVPFEPPLLAKELKAIFPDDNQRQEYVAKILTLCDEARSHAFALQALANRYSADAEATLGVVSRQELNQLVREHEAAVRDEQEELQNILGPFVNVGVRQPQGGSTSPSELWRSHAEMLVEALQREHEDLLALFAISNVHAGSAQATKNDLFASIRAIVERPNPGHVSSSPQ